MANDEADILLENTQLRADLATAKQTVGSLQVQVTSLTAERNTLLPQVEAAVANVATLQANLNAATVERDSLKADNGRLQAQMNDFPRRVAIECARHGI